MAYIYSTNTKTNNFLTKTFEKILYNYNQIKLPFKIFTII